MADPTAATGASAIASLETDPDEARATDALPSTSSPPKSSSPPLSLDPKLANEAHKASSHKRGNSLSLDPTLSPTRDSKPRASIDAPLSLGAAAELAEQKEAAPASPSAPAPTAAPPAPVDTASQKPASTTAGTDAPATPPFTPSSTTPVLENPELDFEGNIAVNNDIPTEKDLKRVDDLLVLDASGESRPFKDLYKGEGVAPRQLIIFIRHFFCGNCQEYLRELSASITPEALLALEQPTFITVVGCGRPELIDMYAKTTGCPFPIYADPTRKLYDLLQMTRTLDLGKKPEYIQSNILFTSLQSIVQSLKTGSNALKGGDFKQVGGEFLFEDGKCTWVHRMRNTRDHAEIAEIRERLGLETTRRPLRKRWSHAIKTLKDQEKDRGRSGSWGRGRSKSKGLKDKEQVKAPEVAEKGTENGQVAAAS